MFQEMLQVGSGGSTKVKKGTFKGLSIGVYTSTQNCGFKPKYIFVFSVGNDNSSYKDASGSSVYNNGEIINSFAQTRSGKLIYYRDSQHANFEITNDGFKYVQNFTGSFENMDMEFLAIGWIIQINKILGE